jgi:catechol O-methyltransferase
MTKGMTIMQLLAKHSGHRLIGADTSYLSPGRVSRYCEKFYRLPTPDPKDSSSYIQAMLGIVANEKVDLWISCSGVLSAIEDAQVKQILEKRTSCRAVQFDVEATRTLHEKDLFMNFIRDECKLTIPETVEVRDKQAVLDILLRQLKAHGSGSSGKSNGIVPKKQYIIKPVGVDDAFRADMTLLPYSPSTVPKGLAPEEATRQHIKKLPISDSRPWLLQEFVKGKEFCTHSIVIDGKVKAFLACSSAELLMHYEALPSPEESKLTSAMLTFTERVANVMQKRSSRERSGGFTGHLSFDFLVKDEELESGGDVTLYPIECNPRAHTATVLFNDCPEVAQAYLKVLNEDESKVNGNGVTNGDAKTAPFYPEDPARYYWLPHDLVTLLLLPLLVLLAQLLATLGFGEQPKERPYLRETTRTFLDHLILWRDGSFLIDDPLPAWWLYHVYWPGQFIKSLVTGRKWSRINVSTTKMFGLE